MKEFIWFFRLAFSRRWRHENPLGALAWRGQTRASQAGMLVAATLFLIAVTAFGKRVVTNRELLVGYVLLRWVLTEFFWIWMSADHLFSTIQKWKKRRAFDDWRLTQLEPAEIAAGFIGPSVGLLMLANAIHTVADVVIPYGPGGGFFSTTGLFNSWKEDVLIWRIGVSLALGVSSFATIAAACAWSYRAAIGSRPDTVHGTWMATLVRCGLMVGTLDFGGAVVGTLLSAVLSNLEYTVQHFYEVVVIGFAFFAAAVVAAYLKFESVAGREWAASIKETEKLRTME